MKRYALAPCNGMSPNGLVARVAVGDCRAECENVISICMGSTSADIEGKNDAMLKKQDIIAVNGCVNNCVNAILENMKLKPKILLPSSAPSMPPSALEREVSIKMSFLKRKLQVRTQESGSLPLFLLSYLPFSLFIKLLLPLYQTLHFFAKYAIIN